MENLIESLIKTSEHIRSTKVYSNQLFSNVIDDCITEIYNCIKQHAITSGSQAVIKKCILILFEYQKYTTDIKTDDNSWEVLVSSSLLESIRHFIIGKSDSNIKIEFSLTTENEFITCFWTDISTDSAVQIRYENQDTRLMLVLADGMEDLTKIIDNNDINFKIRFDYTPQYPEIQTESNINFHSLVGALSSIIPFGFSDLLANGLSQQTYMPNSRQPEINPQVAGPTKEPYPSQSNITTPKFCHFCGNSLKPGAQFCGKCGNKL